jgi:two-component system, NarL family, nitrate/nitrite response regulator NarL
MKKISIVLLEDNRLLRDGISAMLKKEKDFKIDAVFGDSVKALQWISNSAPDIILLDLGLRGNSSLHFVKKLKKDFQDIKIIVMDLSPVQEDVLLFVKAGVSGFILKDATFNDFLKTIRVVITGEKVLPPHLTDSLFTQIINDALDESDNSKLIESVRMTKRERQVIDFVADGLSNKEIAQELNLSPYTIKSHIHNILEKLTLHTRVQIAKYAHTSQSYQDSSK